MKKIRNLVVSSLNMKKVILVVHLFVFNFNLNYIILLEKKALGELYKHVRLINKNFAEKIRGKVSECYLLSDEVVLQKFFGGSRIHKISIKKSLSERRYYNKSFKFLYHFGFIFITKFRTSGICKSFSELYLKDKNKEALLNTSFSLMNICDHSNLSTVICSTNNM